MLEKKYNHKIVEEDKYTKWKNSGYFKCDEESRQRRCDRLEYHQKSRDCHSPLAVLADESAHIIEIAGSEHLQYTVYPFMHCRYREVCRNTEYCDHQKYYSSGPVSRFLLFRSRVFAVVVQFFVIH